MTMHEILIIITATLFYFIGKYSGKEVETMQKVVKDIQKRQNRVPAGAIPLSTPESRKYNGSEREKIDQKAEELLKSQGLL